MDAQKAVLDAMCAILEHPPCLTLMLIDRRDRLCGTACAVCNCDDGLLEFNHLVDQGKEKNFDCTPAGWSNGITEENQRILREARRGGWTDDNGPIPGIITGWRHPDALALLRHEFAQGEVTCIPCHAAHTQNLLNGHKGAGGAPL